MWWRISGRQEKSLKCFFQQAVCFLDQGNNAMRLPDLIYVSCYFLVQGLIFEGCSVFGQEVDFDKQVCRFRAKSPILCNKAGGQKIKNQILYQKMS